MRLFTNYRMEEGDETTHKTQFDDRTSAIFSSLDTLEKQYINNTQHYTKSTNNERDNLPSSSREEHHERRRRKEDSSIKKHSRIYERSNRDGKYRNSFKAPSRRAPRNTNKYHSKMNSKKWTYYNLGDVTADQLSERSNTQAALSFLSTLSKDKDVERSDANGNKHIFTASKVFDDKAVDDKAVNDKSSSQSYRNGVRVMPEYEIGAGKNSTKKDNQISTTEVKSTPQISLNHIDDDISNDIHLSEDIPNTSNIQETVSVIKSREAPSYEESNMLTDTDTDKPKPISFNKRKGRSKRNIRTRDVDK